MKDTAKLIDNGVQQTIELLESLSRDNIQEAYMHGERIHRTEDSASKAFAGKDNALIFRAIAHISAASCILQEADASPEFLVGFAAAMSDIMQTKEQPAVH